MNNMHPFNIPQHLNSTAHGMVFVGVCAWCLCSHLTAKLVGLFGVFGLQCLRQLMVERTGGLFLTRLFVFGLTNNQRKKHKETLITNTTYTVDHITVECVLFMQYSNEL